MITTTLCTLLVRLCLSPAKIYKRKFFNKVNSHLISQRFGVLKRLFYSVSDVAETSLGVCEVKVYVKAAWFRLGNGLVGLVFYK